MDREQAKYNIKEQLDNFEDDLMDGIRKTKDNEVGK